MWKVDTADACRSLKTQQGGKANWNGPYTHALLRERNGQKVCIVCDADYAVRFTSHKRLADDKGATWVSLSAVKHDAGESGTSATVVAGFTAAAAAVAAMAGCLLAQRRRNAAGSGLGSAEVPFSLDEHGGKGETVDV